MVHARSLNVGLTPEDAEDVVQITFEHVYRHLSQLNAPEMLENWIRRIAHNALVSYAGARRSTLELLDSVQSRNGTLAEKTEARAVLLGLRIRLSRIEEYLWQIMMDYRVYDDIGTLADLSGLTESQVRHTREQVFVKVREELDRQEYRGSE